MLNDLSVFARKEILADYVNERNRYTTQKDLAEALAEFDDLDLRRGFTRQNLELRRPSEEEIGRALQSLRKFTPEDQLNCGACGYRTCREKAIAVCQGLAEASMCLPYLVEELEETCERLQLSHQELASAQQRLVQTERLASMGQLSAGVAHELNNPLGTVLIYSHMLLKQLHDGDPARPDLQMIVSEATRCKNIVRGLLDFARQSRVAKAPTRIQDLVRSVVTIVAAKGEAAGVRVVAEVSDDLPTMMIDEGQIKQMLINLVQNGMDAITTGSGEVKVSAGLCRQGEAVEIQVSDTGCGVPPENLAKLFTPFFTTKEMGKGTGLGLAIAYGVIKMHSGDISVESQPGQGTTFTVCLPVGRQEPGDAGKVLVNGLTRAVG
jgi:signal transduction histidine kinase